MSTKNFHFKLIKVVFYIYISKKEAIQTIFFFLKKKKTIQTLLVFGVINDIGLL